ncbi:MAG: hypothetical protein WDO19_30840 [Bacteroidota bacterium]
MKKVSIVGINKSDKPVNLNGTLTNLPAVTSFETYFTSNTENMHRNADVKVKGKIFKTTIPANCIFSFTN